MNEKFWDGKNVHVATDIPGYDSRAVEIGLTRETASALALKLRSAPMGSLPEALEELRIALDYVLVGDPASVAARRRLESGRE